MIVQKLNLEIPAEQDLYAPIKADCMNGSRSFPGVGNPYRIGPVAQYSQIQEALRLLADRDISDPADAADASGLLKPLYLGKPLTQEARDRIAAFPSR